MTRNCGNCRWYEEYVEGDENMLALGFCEWPEDRIPWSLRWGKRERVSVHPHEGDKCPCFEEKADVSTPVRCQEG